MITTMAISRDVPLVDSVFSLLKRAACCLTKCQPRPCPETCPHSDAPSPPQLPLCDYRFGPSTCSFIYTLQQHHHMASLKTPLETAHKIEEATKEQSSCAEWHQLWWSCITSTKFREVCHIRAHSSSENIPGSAPGVSKSSLSLMMWWSDWLDGWAGHVMQT